LQTFLFNLGNERLDCLRKVTFFYDDERYNKKDGLTSVDVILSMLRLLRSLQKVHIVFRRPVEEGTGYFSIQGIEYLPGTNPSLMPGAKTLFSFRKLAHLKVYSPVPLRHYPKANSEVKTLLWHLDAAYRHFNQGLRLAQTGQGFSELYTNEDWFSEETWPALGTEARVCGSETGCSCDVDSEDEEMLWRKGF
jgi:hypothetical protein